MDKTLKEKAQETASELGLPLSTVINNYLKTFIEVKQVTFSAPMDLNKKTINAIKKISKDIQSGKKTSPQFNSAVDAIAWLKTQK